MVENISHNVDNTVYHVKEGERNVQKAVVLKKSATRKKIYLGITCFVILLIIILAIVLAVVLSGRK